MATTVERADVRCINCGTDLTGDHCHGCGQPAHVHRSVAAIGHDLMHGVLHLDGKLWNTVPLLFFRPGQLTRRYVHGERRRFVSPLGMFLFSVTLLFLLMQALGVAPHLNDELTVGPALARAELSLSRAAAGGEQHGAIRQAQRDFASGWNDGRSGNDAIADTISVDEQQRMAQTLAKVREARSIWSDGDDIGSIKDTSSSGFGSTIVEKVRTDPGLLLYKMQANSYKFSWALIPLSVPFVWLLFFWRRDRKLYDHTVFVTYSIAFMTLLTSALIALGGIGVPANGLALAAMTIPPVHIFSQLRGAYELKKRWTIVRLVLLLAFILVIVGLFATILLALGAIG